jgi:CheY-like chemotaxis protein
MHPAYSMKTVLLIEDESTFQFIGKILFRSIGLSTENLFIATGGQDALALLDKLHEDDKPLPDLILLDLYMPVMDGFGFLEAFQKKDYRNKEQTEIIVVTSSHDKDDMQRIKQFGITKYMTKPLDEQKIRAELGL